MKNIIGDKTFDELGLILSQDYEHPGPETRDDTLEIPGMPGAWDFGADLGPLPFNLPCKLLDKSPSGLRKAVRAVTAHLFDSGGKPKTLKLTLRYEPDKFYFVRYSGNMSTVYTTMKSGEFTLPLKAYDPYAYAEITAFDPAGTYEYDTGLQYDSGLMYDNPTSFDWLYTKQYVGFHNYAYMRTPLRLVIKGKVINPRITNRTNGETMTINIATESDDLLVVDAKRYYVVKSTPEYEQYFMSTTFPAEFMKETGAENYMFSKLGDFVHLEPGKNSLMFEGGIPEASVQMIWYHMFM
ncbi:phage tail domain-containing protein [Tuberibacillus sp. Marseille-P3662]|uniref:phage tail domain-containing protein n=1 Tax=Tuberibacillus sp. Marseille-P3662 TaxID=1965358 RepID=UPI000A1CE9CF|nr:phage tail domain-containing protein [Tuberibacillus sp. Marseille-P3662]